MVKFLAVTLAFGALLSRASAIRTFKNFPSEFRVGVLVTLEWDLNPGESVDRLTLEHEGRPGEVLQYETLVQWAGASGEDNKGLGVTSVDWIPNVAGPTFNLILNDNGIYSPQFSILAADGTPVTAVPYGIDRFSNIEPQTATAIWYPNDPHKAAATTSQSSATSTTSAQVFSTLMSAAASAMSTYTSSTSSTSSSLIVVQGTTITTASSPALIASTTTTTCSTSTSQPPAPTTTLFTSSILPIENATTTTTPHGNSTLTGLVTHTPTQAVSNTAGTMKSGMGAAVMAVLGCVGIWAML